MQKRIIIFGKANSGKSHLANQMAMAFENPVFLDGRNLHHKHFKYQEVEDDTDLMVIDDLNQKLLLKDLTYYDRITVHRKGDTSFLMSLPKIIITIECDEDFIDDLDVSIKRRSIFIKCEADHNDTMPALQANRYYTQTEILNA